MFSMCAHLTLVVFALSLLSIIGYTWKNGISPMPISKRAGLIISELIPFSGVIYELGSGWGHLLRHLVKQHPDQMVVAYENSLVPYVFSLIFRRERVHIYWKDFHLQPLYPASAVVCYLHPKGMKKLESKFKNELGPNTLIVSHVFTIPGWQPERIIDVGDLYHSKIYIYRT